MFLNILIKTSLLMKVKCVVEISRECHPQDSLPRPRTVLLTLKVITSLP